jgi:hypothetical protein
MWISTSLGKDKRVKDQTWNLCLNDPVVYEGASDKTTNLLKTHRKYSGCMFWLFLKVLIRPNIDQNNMSSSQEPKLGLGRLIVQVSRACCLSLSLSLSLTHTHTHVRTHTQSW